MQHMSETENDDKKSAEIAENKDTAESAESAGKQIYELGYLLVPTIAEENAPALFGNLKELVVSFGGEIISSEMPRMIRLAYVMAKTIDNVKNKFDTAYFGWIKFEAEKSAVAEIKKKLDANTDLIRFLITKTVRENTLAPKKFSGGGSSRYRGSAEHKEEKEPSAPMDEEKVDKEIEALVTEAA